MQGQRKVIDKYIANKIYIIFDKYNSDVLQSILLRLTIPRFPKGYKISP